MAGKKSSRAVKQLQEKYFISLIEKEFTTVDKFNKRNYNEVIKKIETDYKQTPEESKRLVDAYLKDQFGKRFIDVYDDKLISLAEITYFNLIKKDKSEWEDSIVKLREWAPLRSQVPDEYSAQQLRRFFVYKYVQDRLYNEKQDEWEKYAETHELKVTESALSKRIKAERVTMEKEDNETKVHYYKIDPEE